MNRIRKTKIISIVVGNPGPFSSLYVDGSFDRFVFCVFNFVVPLKVKRVKGNTGKGGEEL